MPFFSRIPVDKKQIEAAISRLESLSSAELRVYIERKVPKASAQLSAMERALEVFDELEMHKTAAQNAFITYDCTEMIFISHINQHGILCCCFMHFQFIKHF